MTSPPDKLFRQGLEDYQKPAPGSAWERIESGLDRKRNRIPWLKIAAGLLILIASTTVILQFNRTDTSIATFSIESDIVSSEQLAVSSRQSAVDSSQLNSIVERSRNNQLDVVNKNPRSLSGVETNPEGTVCSLQSPVTSWQSPVSSPQPLLTSPTPQMNHKWQRHPRQIKQVLSSHHYPKLKSQMKYPLLMRHRIQNEPTSRTLRKR